MNLNWSLNKGIPVGNNCGYVGITFDKLVTFTTEQGKRQFRIVIYGAYNVFGLIGPEKNGIVILDIDNYQVVLDDYQQMVTGYHGPNSRVLKTADNIGQMNWDNFQQFCNSNNKSRYKI